MISNFKFLTGQYQRPISEPRTYDSLPNGLWGILYRDRNNNLLMDLVRLDGHEYWNDNWIEYDTGFITMEFFFFSFRHTFNYSVNPQPFTEPVVRSIEHNGVVYDIRYSNFRRLINSYIWNANDMVRIIGKKYRHATI